jgi:poly-gamma-glutamate capsule biosynthesis protein CapA/YwtB (metallophosphatase superfamily)
VNETARQLETAGIAYVDTDLSPAWLDTAAGRLAVIAAQDVIGKLDEAQLLQAVRQASAVSDYLIVSMHWGNEYQAGPDERQQRLAKALADAGADLIWGHHPHVLQKMEWLPTADGRQVLVIYSLGNLLSDQWMLEDTRQTVLLRLSYAQMRLVQIEVIPLNLERENKALHLLKNSEGLLATLLPDGLTSLPVEIELND